MKKHLLAVCVGNICRSPMASVLLNDALTDNYKVSSAGIGALVGEPAHPIALRLMAERKLDLSDHVARQIDDALVRESELIMVMETSQQRWIEARWPHARGRVFRLGHWGDFEIPDPYRRGETRFRESLELIEQGIAQWREKLILLAESSDSVS